MKSLLFRSLLIALATVLINAAAAADSVVKAQTSTPPVAVKTEALSSQTIVVGNQDTKRYHLPGMPYYNKVDKDHRVYFDSEQQAIANGYYKAGTVKDSTGATVKAEAPISKQATPAASATPPPPVKSSPEVLPKSEINPDMKTQDTPKNVLRHNAIIGAFIMFLILMALPFLPGILEIIRKEDADPLFIAMNYNKDPRYFGRSFKQIFQKSIAGLPAGPQTSEVMLSKKENVQITESLHVSPAAQIKNLLFVEGDMSSAVNAHFNKEVYVSGNSDIGPDNILHVLAGDGDITVAKGTTFERWLDTQGNMDIGSNCRLGISASCGGSLYLANACSFRRLYAMPIITGNDARNVSVNPQAAWMTVPSITTTEKPVSSFIRKTDSSISPKSKLDNHIVFLNKVSIGHNSVINGSIKCYGDLKLEENVTVNGNIFADGNITIGKGSIISGHIFSQGEIIISEHSIISRPNVVKSIIGKKSIRLAPNVTIYGYVSTEGKGTVS